jgi:IS5 family transposase
MSQEEPALRVKRHCQRGLDYSGSHLALTNGYYAKYAAMSTLLRETPQLVDLVHRDLAGRLETINRSKGGGGRLYAFSSDQVLRILVCQVIEGLSLRGIVVRIDDSHCLRRFVGVDNGPMMDFTTLCKLKNAISNETWAKVNRCLAETAVAREAVVGDSLRIDTTAVETNIHWPTDSSLLWDTYRVLARLIERGREVDPAAVGTGRVQLRRVKRLQQRIARRAATKGCPVDRLRPLYSRLIQHIEHICRWAGLVRQELTDSPRLLDVRAAIVAMSVVEEIGHYLELGGRVIDQARRRVIDGESVPNEEKIFSIFESHTELLKRGKAGKDVEFGHMIQIQQVASKFITDYDVFEKRPVEHALLGSALKSHRSLFGDYPDVLAADKGYYHSRDALERLRQKVRVVSIGKKGSRTAQEVEAEHDQLFRHAQRFRAGVEGTISFLKRVLGLARSVNKGWEHFAATVAQTIFAHNLLVLARC